MEKSFSIFGDRFFVCIFLILFFIPMSHWQCVTQKRFNKQCQTGWINRFFNRLRRWEKKKHKWWRGGFSFSLLLWLFVKLITWRYSSLNLLFLRNTHFTEPGTSLSHSQYLFCFLCCLISSAFLLLHVTHCDFSLFWMSYSA